MLTGQPPQFTFVQWKSPEWWARTIQSQQPGGWKIDALLPWLCDIPRDRLPGEGFGSHGNRTCPGSPLGQGHLVPTSTPAPFIGFLSRGYRITGVCLPSFPIQRFDSSFYPKKFQDLDKFYIRRIHTKLSRTFFAKVFFHSSMTLSRKQCRSNFSWTIKIQITYNWYLLYGLINRLHKEAFQCSFESTWYLKTEDIKQNFLIICLLWLWSISFYDPYINLLMYIYIL